MKNKVFNCDESNSIFQTKGYLIVPNFYNNDECDNLLKYHKTLDPETRETFFATQNSLNYCYRKKVSEYLDPIFAKKIKSYTNNFKLLYSQFMVKRPGKNSSCNMHQDWSFVEEPKHFSITLWVSLQDSNRKNGCLWLMPGSHNFENYHRGRNIEQASLEQSKLIRKYFLTPIELKKGDAVFFHSRTLHESYENKSESDRIGAASLLIPENATSIHYFKTNFEDNSIKKISVNSEFYVTHSCLEPPRNYKEFSSIIHYKKKISKTDIFINRLNYLFNSIKTIRK